MRTAVPTNAAVSRLLERRIVGRSTSQRSRGLRAGSDARLQVAHLTVRVSAAASTWLCKFRVADLNWNVAYAGSWRTRGIISRFKAEISPLRASEIEQPSPEGEGFWVD